VVFNVVEIGPQGAILSIMEGFCDLSDLGATSDSRRAISAG